MMKHTVLEYVSIIQDGGAETLVKDYALLVNKGLFNLYVLTLRDRKESANSQLMRRNGIQVISIYGKWNLATRIWNKIIGKYYVRYKIKKVIQRINPHVVHMHLECLHHFKHVSKLLKKRKLFYTCHSLPERMLGANRRDEFHAAKYLIEHNGLRLVALHHDMAKELNDMFAVDNTVVIKNGINFRRFKGIVYNKNELRSKLGIPTDAFVLGHIGRFHPIKNHDFLIETFKETISRNEKAFLFLIGNGKTLEEIKHKVRSYQLEERVLILSHRSDVPELMKAMDVFVFPSLSEGFGIVMIEAQLSGLRCIASDKVPEAAFVTDLAVPMNLNDGPSKWAEAILDPDRRGVAKGNIHEYDMNIEIKKLETLYQYGKLDVNED